MHRGKASHENKLIPIMRARNLLLENVQMNLLIFFEWDDTAVLVITHLSVLLAGYFVSRCSFCRQSR